MGGVGAPDRRALLAGSIPFPAQWRCDLKVLVTGGCGYIGTRLTQALIERTPHEVDVLDTMWFGNHLVPHPRLTVRQLDVRRIDDVDLSGYDTIFHLANIANDPSVELNPYSSWEVNVLAGMRLIDRAARQGVRQFVFASSASVYGLKSEPRVTEDLDLYPLSEYNKTKMVAERVVLSYADSMTTTVIRPATVCGYSPRMRLDVVVNMLTVQALSRGKITVLGGDQTRPNIHIDDLVDVYLFSLDRRLQGVFNAGFENLSVMEIARAVTREVPAEIEVKPSNDPRSYFVCSDKLLGTGFAPKRNVQTAIREMAAAYHEGRITDDPISYNVRWMRQNTFA
jgi:nucleoside-diphosphate-sugar epimerase